jgi:Mn-containing catalase
MRTLEYVLKQQTRWERAYFKALRDLQALQKPRPPQHEPPEDTEPEPVSKTSKQSHSDPQPKQNEPDARISHPPSEAGQEELPGSGPFDHVKRPDLSES